MLILEKVEFLSGKEKVQDELVYTLDELMYQGKRILYTGNAFPKDIPRLTNELQSRLSGILAAPIEPPDSHQDRDNSKESSCRKMPICPGRSSISWRSG